MLRSWSLVISSLGVSLANSFVTSLTWGNSVQLNSGDALDPDLETDIPFTLLKVVLMSDMLFDESVHQQIVQCLLSQYPRLQRLIKTKEIPHHMQGLFHPPIAVTLNVSWCASN